MAGNDSYVTQGDANNIPDNPIEKDAVKGAMVASVPYAGIIVRFLQSAPGAILTIALAILLMNLSWKKERAEDDQKLDAIKDEIRRLKQQEEARQKQSTQQPEGDE